MIYFAGSLACNSWFDRTTSRVLLSLKLWSLAGFISTGWRPERSPRRLNGLQLRAVPVPAVILSHACVASWQLDALDMVGEEALVLLLNGVTERWPTDVYILSEACRGWMGI